MRTTLVLLALLACVFAQNFKCDIQYQTMVMRNGVVSGTFAMTSIAPARTQINLPAKIVGGVTLREAFTELVQYNSANGFNGGSALPYTDQIAFTSGTTCACETGYEDSSMPLLNPYDSNTLALLNAFYNKGGVDSSGCNIYTPKATPDTSAFPSLMLNLISAPLTEVHINPTTNYPCWASWDDGTSITFSNCQSATFNNATDFVAPTGCQCGKPIDIVFVLDRSGSISVLEFDDEKGFVIDFCNQFEFSPLKANLAIINFQSTAWIQLAITDGNTDANVNASVQSLGCPTSCDIGHGSNCDGNVANCCCCCGTCISCGLRLGADQFPLGRNFAFKIIIVITDGYANTPSPGYTCSPDCSADLQAAVTYVISKAPDPTQVALYAVGVGADRDVSAAQLLIVADNLPDHVLRRDSFSELASISVELVGRSCDQNLSPCGGCCGFCLCGKCQPPDTCANTSLCNSGTLPAGQVCCTTTPTSCAVAESNDKCSTYVCNDKTGLCVANTSTTLQCGLPQNTTCFNRSCIPATGLCKTDQTGKCPAMAECANASDCNDNNLCTNDSCNADGACVWTVVNCSSTLTGDKCNSVQCDPLVKGCYLKPVNVTATCNDNNLCTTDACDPQLGCTNTNVTNCVDGNPCTIDTCDPFKGCIFVPRVCNLSGNSSCRLAVCNRTTGNCSFELVACGTVLPVGIVIGSSIGAAALVGIVIAAIICAAGAAGGGAYAYVQAQGNGALAETKSNPLYKGDGNQGMNPLYRG